jgi:hypothetical protein
MLKNYFIKKFLLNDQGQPSFTKIGAEIVAIAGWLLASHLMTPNWTPILQAIIAAGGAMGLAGARDALTK